MTNERAIELLNIEKECVKRQFGPLCKRTIIPMEGCSGCDLAQNDKDILEAYDKAIEILAQDVESGSGERDCKDCIHHLEGGCETWNCDFERRPTDV